MQTIADHRIRFGELAGPLAHGASFFDWLLVSTQEATAAFGHPFEEILADDGIPYAPVVVDASIERYPTVGSTLSVETVPRRVGDSSVELVYAFDDGDGRLATARVTHVTISPSGEALSIPADVRSAMADACVARDPSIGPETDLEAGAQLPSFDISVDVRRPHLEGAELAYFEEYPRFATVALEEYLADRGTPLGELRGETFPFRVRDWHWEFEAPVRYESTLAVECDVRAVEDDTVRVRHELSSGGRTNIAGVTEYGCFDRSGDPVAFPEAARAVFRGP